MSLNTLFATRDQFVMDPNYSEEQKIVLMDLINAKIAENI